MITPKYAYFEGEIVPFEQAKVSVLTHALNYGTGAFGGVRAYWNEDEEQLFLFRPEEHFKRLLNSAKLLCMEFDHTPEELVDITIQLLTKEAYRTDVYIRPLVYKADTIIGVRLHDLLDEISIVALPFQKYVDNDTNAHVTFSSWRRIDDNMIPARGKITGAYANSALIKTDAIRSGYDEALVLTQEGHVSEGSAENLFMIRDEMLITPSVTENILEGITRRSVLTIVKEIIGMPIVERPIDRTEIYLCDELFLSGTAAQVTAVTQVDHRPIGTGEMGPVATRVRAIFDNVVRGKDERYKDWLQTVY